MQFLEADWLQTDCLGAPDFMSVYTKDSPSAVFEFIQSEFAYPTCGIDPLERPQGCCYSSLSKADTYGYQSLSANFVDNSKPLLSNAPLSANTNTYCSIISNGSYYNSVSAYILQNDKCINRAICSSNSLTIYEYSNCTGNAESFNIQPNIILSIVSDIGDFSISQIIISEGGVVYGWESFVPNRLLYPIHTSLYEKLALVGFILAILGSVIALSIYSVKLYHRKTLHNYLGLWSQLIWAIEHSQTMFLDYYIFPSQDAVDIYSSIFCFSNVASLLSVSISIDLITKLFYCTKPVRRLAFISAVIVHLAFVGWSYLEFLTISNPDLFNYLTFKLGVLPTFWNIVMFIIDLGPPLIVMQKVIVSSAHSRQKIENWQIEVFVLVVIHLINTIIYGILGYLAGKTEYFANDRNIQALWGINRFQFMVNCLIVLRFNYYLHMLLNGHPSTPSSEKGEKSDKGSTSRTIERSNSKVSSVKVPPPPVKKGAVRIPVDKDRIVAKK
ncbi:hypothetical protein HDV06_000483 [Boothiomyces sp. JEL0866]|nr:hypothetical protein HDV06_000483 [Boothiomyces sp. JEL0866]